MNVAKGSSTKPSWLAAIEAEGQGIGRVIIPLDQPDAESAIELADRMIKAGAKCFKVGLELIMSFEAKDVIDYLLLKKCVVFFDCKLHDISATVAGAIRNAVKHGVHIINVHATGSFAMMQAAAKAAQEAAEEFGVEKPLIIAVTVLTSVDLGDLRRMGFVDMSEQEFERLPETDRQNLLREIVVGLAELAKEADLDGVVASALHAEVIRNTCGDEFAIVCPGIRFADGKKHDQKQVATPFNVGNSGADFAVIGRAITGANIPGQALSRAASDILAGRVSRAGAA